MVFSNNIIHTSRAYTGTYPVRRSNTIGSPKGDTTVGATTHGKLDSFSIAMETTQTLHETVFIHRETSSGGEVGYFTHLEANHGHKGGVCTHQGETTNYSETNAMHSVAITKVRGHFCTRKKSSQTVLDGFCTNSKVMLDLTKMLSQRPMRKTCHRCSTRYGYEGTNDVEPNFYLLYFNQLT